MKGIILGLDAEHDAVIILDRDDKRYRLPKSEWKSAREPKVGMAVDFVAAGEDLAREAYYIPTIVENQGVAQFATKARGIVKRFKKLLFGIGLALAVVVLVVLILHSLHSKSNVDYNQSRLNDLRAKAEKGDVWSQFDLGFDLMNSNDVANDDNVEAVKWFRKAAEQDFAPAQFHLGCSYAEGRGVAKNEVEAVKWYRKAAEQDEDDAQYNLGCCYGNGQGVEKDYVEAYKWFVVSAAQGYESAKNAATKLEGIMSPAQIAEGKRRASVFKPQETSSHDVKASNASDDSTTPPMPIRQLDDANTYNIHGGMKYTQGDWAGALTDYTKAIELNPDFAEAYNGRGAVKYRQGNLAGALADYNKAIELKPNRLLQNRVIFA
jgi:TPR repeat protein